ncbi:Up in starvation [Mucor velutinosus]|uniref:Up in starvation n=1 Tax=Mucor velutinosus TaxID=708070 RepID=A0AAN7HVX9_9FUNG|nr:Up in starvation [Mucor velutinosus]
MKRSNDAQQQDDNKKPRYSNHSDLYAQYGMMPQYGQGNPFAQGAAATTGYGSFVQPNTAAAMYAMGYGNPHAMMAGQYGGAYPQAFNAGAVGGSAMQTEPLRSIYLGNFSKDMDPHDVLKCVHTGLVDSFRAMPEKSCAFLTFVEPAAAQMFYQEFLTKKLIVGDTEIKIGWGKPTKMPPLRKQQIQNGATRNVYLGRLTEADTEETIQAAVSEFGPIEQIKLLREKNIAFVHFLNIAAATNCVAALTIDEVWKNKRVNYGKDHCADLTEQFNPAAAYNHPYANIAANYAAHIGLEPYTMNVNYTPFQANDNAAQRTLYFGNIHPEATCEDLCNIIRGGTLFQIRYFPEKHIAFVTFMDAETALTVHNHASTTGFIIKGRKARVGWGKPSKIPLAMLLAYQNGATRNIYLGGIDDKFSAEKLRTDCARYGEIELVNLCQEKNCAFVNFTSMSSAVAAIQGLKKFNAEYADLKINYGKDRCSNPWKVMKKGKPAGNTTTNIKREDNETPNDAAAADSSKQGEQVNTFNKPNKIEN